MFDVPPNPPFPPPPRPVYLNRQMNRLIPNPPNPRSPKTGFTLVEILVVVAIIGILAGIVLKISGFAAGKSDRAKALADLEKIKMGLEEYRLNNGQYWATAVISNATDATAFSNAVGHLVNGGIRMTDPWGRYYRYERQGLYSYRLWSTGPKANANTPEDDVDSAAGAF